MVPFLAELASLSERLLRFVTYEFRATPQWEIACNGDFVLWTSHTSEKFSLRSKVNSMNFDQMSLRSRTATATQWNQAACRIFLIQKVSKGKKLEIQYQVLWPILSLYYRRSRTTLYAKVRQQIMKTRPCEPTEPGDSIDKFNTLLFNHFYQGKKASPSVTNTQTGLI